MNVKMYVTLNNSVSVLGMSWPIERFIQIVHLCWGLLWCSSYCKSGEACYRIDRFWGACWLALVDVWWMAWHASIAKADISTAYLCSLCCLPTDWTLLLWLHWKGHVKTFSPLLTSCVHYFCYAKTNDVFMKVQRETKVNVYGCARAIWNMVVFYALCIRCLSVQDTRNPDDHGETSYYNCCGLYHELASWQMILTFVVLKKALAIATNLSDLLQKLTVRMDKCSP